MLLPQIMLLCVTSPEIEQQKLACQIVELRMIRAKREVLRVIPRARDHAVSTCPGSSLYVFTGRDGEVWGDIC